MKKNLFFLLLLLLLLFSLIITFLSYLALFVEIEESPKRGQIKMASKKEEGATTTIKKHFRMMVYSR